MSGNDPVPNRVWSSRGSRDSLVKEFGPQAMAEVAAAAEKERQRPALASAASAASAVGCGASKPPLYYREYSQDRDRLFALHLRPQRPLTRANAVSVPKTPDQARTSYPAVNFKSKKKKLNLNGQGRFCLLFDCL